MALERPLLSLRPYGQRARGALPAAVFCALCVKCGASALLMAALRKCKVV